MTTRRTATIVRYHCFGTPRMQQRVKYRGRVLSWAGAYPFTRQYADAPDYGHETIGEMIEIARRQGFTHVRFAGDWKGLTVRKTMKIRPGRYEFKHPPIGEILRRLGMGGAA